MILLPIVLIIAGTIIKSFADNPIIEFASNTNVILLFTVFLAFFMLRKYLTHSFNDIVSDAAESVGSIIAIISAGGGFGTVISSSGLGDYLVNGLQSFGIPLIILAFVLTQVLRMGLGSITVLLFVSLSELKSPVFIQIK